MSYAALVDQTRATRITPDTAQVFKAKARRCQWCARTALKGQGWCQRHGPGRHGDRRDRRHDDRAVHTALLAVIQGELGAEGCLPAWAAAWPPVARLVAITPRHKRPVMLRRVIAALVAAACGDGEPWAAAVHELRAAGLLLASDPPLPAMRGEGGP